jgi:hypothetical protein
MFASAPVRRATREGLTGSDNDNDIRIKMNRKGSYRPAQIINGSDGIHADTECLIGAWSSLRGVTPLRARRHTRFRNAGSWKSKTLVNGELNRRRAIRSERDIKAR